MINNSIFNVFQPCKPLSMSSTDARNLRSTLFTSSLELRVVLVPSNLVPVLNLLSEHSPVVVWESEESRMLPPSLPIPQEEKVVVEEEDFEEGNLFYFFSSIAKAANLYLFSLLISSLFKWKILTHFSIFIYMLWFVKEQYFLWFTVKYHGSLLS